MRKLVEDVVAQEENRKNEKANQKKQNDHEYDSPSHTVHGKSSPARNTIDRELEEILASLTTTIKVVGCGGAGTNTISRCLEGGVSGTDLIAVNTDAQHLLKSPSPRKVLIGRHLTRGLGAGSIPKIGEEAAKESEQDIRESVGHADMVFITCGLGGGTGTGSAPIVAQLAKEAGALTIGVVTLPFNVEGLIRMENAEAGLKRLREICDTVIVIPNDKLLDVVPNLSLNAAFRVADELLMRSIKGITEMITKPGLVNLDFADLKTVMKRGGVAMIGLGEAEGENKAVNAVVEALNSPTDMVGLQPLSAFALTVLMTPRRKSICSGVAAICASVVSSQPETCKVYTTFMRLCSAESRTQTLHLAQMTRSS